MMHGHGQSDRRVVPTKSPNKAGRPVAEEMEGRRLAKGNPPSETRSGHRAGSACPRALERIREVAERDRKMRFTALLHHVYDRRTPEGGVLRAEAERGTRRGRGDVAALRRGPGGNLEDLSERLKRGAYRAEPVRRAYIPKADGRQRPLGVPALEDKIVQRATVEVLNAIYEADFLGFSYGFRPGRSPHDALDALYVGILRRKVNWVLDADIRGFFDAIDHGWLVKFIEHRIADQRVVRLIQKWLNAGVLEDGTRTWSETGTPQGAVYRPFWPTCTCTMCSISGSIGGGGRRRTAT